MLCEKTIYNYINFGALAVKNIENAEKIRYRVRQKTQMSYKVGKSVYRIEDMMMVIYIF